MNAVDFGDNTGNGSSLGGVSSGINNRGILTVQGGSGQQLNYITIDTPGNAVEFGNHGLNANDQYPSSGGSDSAL